MSRLHFVMLAALFGCWLGSVCVPVWMSNPDYQYGWIVLPLAGYFMARRLESTGDEGIPKTGAVVAWVLLWMAALLVFPVELGRLAPLEWRVFSWASYLISASAILVSAYLTGGKRLGLAMIFPLLFLATAVPWPVSWELNLTHRLMFGIAKIVGEVLPTLGVPADVQGTTIHLENTTVGIEEACSGIRSLQTGIMLALAIGELLSLRVIGRVLLVVLAGILTLPLNLARTFGLAWVGAEWGSEGIATVHDGFGLAVLVLLGGGIFLLARGLPKNENVSSSNAPLVKPGGTMSWAVFAMAVLGLLAAHGWYFAHERLRPEGISKPVMVYKQGGELEFQAIPESLRYVLAYGDGEFYMLPGADGGMGVSGYHIFWNEDMHPANQLYHRPDVCMPGGGWKVIGASHQVTSVLQSGRRITWTALPFEKAGVRAVLLWTAFLDSQPMMLDLEGRKKVQELALWQMIRNGRRSFSFEVASILIPGDWDDQFPERAAALAEQIFD